MPAVSTPQILPPVAAGRRCIRARQARGGGVAIAVVAVLCCLACAPPPASAQAADASPEQAGLYIAGAGFGHGVGMSQYGALGFALHGFSADQILTHYYQGTTLGKVTDRQLVTVLLGNGRPSFAGANRANGKPLDPATTYAVVPAGADLALLDGRRTVGRFAPPLTVSGPGPLELVRTGSYRGSFVFREEGRGRIQTVNQVGLEDYLRGVVSREMPASWPAAALQAQAIAARSYVLSEGAVGVDFQVYDDTRSQVYGGVAAETPQTDAAVAATAGEVVEYGGAPVATYFFSSSGGYTEDVQNVWIGDAPEAWLQGVADPYDDSGGNPNYRWHVAMSLRTAGSRLRGLVRGALVGIQVLRRGVSPRVVSAAVVGSDGQTVVSGSQLEQLLGLKSTYLNFKTITASGSGGAGGSGGTGGSGGSGGSGGAGSGPQPGTTTTTTTSAGTAPGVIAPTTTAPGTTTPGTTTPGTTTPATTTPGATTPTSTSPPTTATAGAPGSGGAGIGSPAALVAPAARQARVAILPGLGTQPAPVPWQGSAWFRLPAASVSGPAGSPAGEPGRAPQRSAPSGGGRPRRLSPLISGTIFPHPRRRARVVILRLTAGHATPVARGRASANGFYTLRVPGPGRYRVNVGGTQGPTITIR